MREKTRNVWLILHPKGYIHTFWEDTVRVAVYATQEEAIKIAQEMDGKFAVIRGKIIYQPLSKKLYKN